MTLKESENMALKNEVQQLTKARALAVSAAVSDQLKETSEARAAAFREGMAYAMSTFKEMHELQKRG